MVRRAAEIEGRTATDFVFDAAQQAARKTIEDIHVIRPAAEDQLRLPRCCSIRRHWRSTWSAPALPMPG
jgi:uncharacterized protein (DUF1778 family)